MLYPESHFSPGAESPIPRAVSVPYLLSASQKIVMDDMNLANTWELLPSKVVEGVDLRAYLGRRRFGINTCWVERPNRPHPALPITLQPNSCHALWGVKQILDYVLHRIKSLRVLVRCGPLFYRHVMLPPLASFPFSKAVTATRPFSAGVRRPSH